MRGSHSQFIAHAANKTQDQPARNLVTTPTDLSQLHSHTYFLTHTTVILCGVQHNLNYEQVRNEHSYGQLHIYKQGHPGKIQTPVHWNLTAPPCVITQQYYSTTFILLDFHSHTKKILCAFLFNPLMPNDPLRGHAVSPLNSPNDP